MARAITSDQLVSENHAYRHTGGVSERNRSLGFVPAFLDRDTGIVYLSRNGDGSVAGCHRMDCLPEAIVARRDEHGRARELKPSVVAGFEREGRFFTRDEAAQLASEPH